MNALRSTTPRLPSSVLVLLLLIPGTCGISFAEILLVPESYATINTALDSSSHDDTVLVNRGFYDEQLWFPPHRVYVMSHYALTGDTLDVLQTVIECVSYADHDTATIALFLHPSGDGSQLCGFLLQGGRGVGPGIHSGAFLADSCSAVVCHNIITDNHCGRWPAGSFAYCSGALRFNRIHNNYFGYAGIGIGYGLYWEPVLVEGNYFGPNPASPNASIPGIELREGSRSRIIGNTFRGFTGVCDLAISGLEIWQTEISNNVFDSLAVNHLMCGVVNIFRANADLIIRDNVFTHLQLEDGAPLQLLDGAATENVFIEGNYFEDIRAAPGTGGTVAPGVWLQAYSGIVNSNIFRNCRGTFSGPVYTVQAGFVPPDGLTLEYNLFEDCSTTSELVNMGIITHSSYNGPVVAHFNIFRRNYPRIASWDPVFPERIADFTLNYWGHPSGPYHPVHNPQGLGDAVGDSVLFDPWLLDSNITAAPEPPPPLPTAFKLESYPNPFNPETRLKLTVAEPGRYRLELFDIAGRRVRELFDGAVVIDREVTVNAGDLPSGMYFAHATRSLNRYPVATAKLVLLK